MTPSTSLYFRIMAHVSVGLALAAAILVIFEFEAGSAASSRSRTQPALQQRLLSMAQPFDTLPPGARLTGTVTYGSDLARPTLFFSTVDGRVFVKTCQGEGRPVCYAIQLQAAFAANQKVTELPGASLEVTGSAAQLTVYRLAVGHQALLTFSKQPRPEQLLEI